MSYKSLELEITVKDPGDSNEVILGYTLWNINLEDPWDLSSLHGKNEDMAPRWNLSFGDFMLLLTPDVMRKFIYDKAY